MKKINAYHYPTLAELEAWQRQRGGLTELLNKHADHLTKGLLTHDGLEEFLKGRIYRRPDLRTFPSSDVLRQETSRFTQPMDGDSFHWITSKGEALLPKDMATPHLFYALRMMFNNTVAPVFRIGKFNRRADVKDWPEGYAQIAAEALTNELLDRDDLDLTVSDGDGVETIYDQLQDLLKNVDVIYKGGFYQ